MAMVFRVIPCWLVCLLFLKGHLTVPPLFTDKPADCPLSLSSQALLISSSFPKDILHVHKSHSDKGVHNILYSSSKGQP